MAKNNKNIAVLYGGHPDEAEISRKSAMNVLRACFDLGLDPVLLNVNAFDIRSALEAMNNPLILNMVHGKWGEDGSAQKLFEELEIPYFGSSVFASMHAFDKEKFRNLVGSTVRLPKGDYLTKEEYVKEWKTFPHVIKPSNGGSTIGVQYIAKSGDADLDKWMGEMLVEEFIDGPEGATVLYKGECIGGVMVSYSGKIFDYKTKYDPKLSKLEPWDKLDKDMRAEISRFSETIYKKCKCSGFVCVDFRISSKGVPYILEANTIPGMTETSLVPYVFKRKGIDFEQLVEMMINDAEVKRGTYDSMSENEIIDDIDVV